ncbi:MAG: YfiR family protein, partial [Burkholderiales bacterium]
VKGALLHRFIAYVEWPESAFAGPDSPLVIGILGNDTLAAELQAFEAGRRADKRPITVRRVRAPDNLKDVHLLFIDGAERQQLERAARAAPFALIVTEWPNALKQGSVINFTLVNDQLRFEISLESARQRNLRLSSRLLSVAHDVRAATP